MQKAWCEVYVETLFELWKDLIAFSNSPSNTRKMTQEEKVGWFKLVVLFQVI